MNCLSIVVVPALASTGIGSCILGLAVGVLLGILCGVKCRQKRTEKNMHHSIPDSPVQNAAEEATAVPIYEDVTLVSDMNAIELSHNIAYEQCVRISK